MLSLNDILTSLQQGVQGINNLSANVSTLNATVSAVNNTIKTTFPQAGALSATATTGALTYSSSQPATFLTVITSSGGTYKVPLFNP
jgi:hypothetical protein